MKTLNKLMLTIAAAAAAIPTMTFAQIVPQSVTCDSISAQMHAVALAAPRSGALVNFSGSGGQLDPVPLLESNFTVIGLPQRPVCVALTFSAQIDPTDNYGVYQASIDNNPMLGHGSMTAEYPAITTPVVFDAVNQGSYLPVAPYNYPNYGNSRFVSYTFFAMVLPGTHTMRIKMAACCSPSPGGIGGVSVRAATALLRW
jgi:hypothetical protein